MQWQLDKLCLNIQHVLEHTGNGWARGTGGCGQEPIRDHIDLVFGDKPVGRRFWQHLWRRGITELCPGVSKRLAGGECGRWTAPGRLGRSGDVLFHSAILLLLLPVIAFVELGAAWVLVMLLGAQLSNAAGCCASMIFGVLLLRTARVLLAVVLQVFLNGTAAAIWVVVVVLVSSGVAGLPGTGARLSLGRVRPLLVALFRLDSSHPTRLRGVDFTHRWWCDVSRLTSMEIQVKGEPVAWTFPKDFRWSLEPRGSLFSSKRVSNSFLQSSILSIRWNVVKLWWSKFGDILSINKSLDKERVQRWLP